jgi:ferredoxin-NADP reductase
MTSYVTWLTSREEIATGTMAFHFAKPTDFGFKPGQAIDVVLPNPPVDAQSARHTFSIVSAPYEHELAIATRMRDSAFKRALKAMPIGSQAVIEGPFGSLTMHSDRARAAVLIAGGIGITPFMSMLRQANTDRLPHRLVLIYSNRRPEDAAFLAELQALERQSEAFRLVATMTGPIEPSDHWDRQTGLIDGPLIQRAVAGLQAPIYYVAGPPGLVQAMRVALSSADVDDDDIRSEEFYGY